MKIHIKEHMLVPKCKWKGKDKYKGNDIEISEEAHQ
jgi:hypothetical protein